MIIQCVGVLLWLIIVPFCLGLSVSRWIRREYQNLTMIMVTGYFVMLACFQVIYLPFIVFYNHFEPLVWVYSVIMALFSGFALVCNGKYWLGVCREKIKSWKQARNAGKSESRNNYGIVILWLGAIFLIGFQIYKKIFYQFHDGDDAFYAVTSVITNTTKNMYVNLPYTGESSVLDKRHAFSAAPVFISFLAEVCRMHPIIMTQIVYSVFILILIYMIYKLIGDILLPRCYVPLFLIFVSLMNIFGNATIYTNSTFLLTRTGQGKAFLANIIPAAAILGLLLVWKNLDRTLENDQNNADHKTKGILSAMNMQLIAPWILLSCIMITAVYTSLMGILLSGMLIGGVTVLFVLIYRKIQLLVPCMLAMVPLLMIGLLYLRVFLG